MLIVTELSFVLLRRCNILLLSVFWLGLVVVYRGCFFVFYSVVLFESPYFCAVCTVCL